MTDQFSEMSRPRLVANHGSGYARRGKPCEQGKVMASDRPDARRTGSAASCGGLGQGPGDSRGKGTV